MGFDKRSLFIYVPCWFALHKSERPVNWFAGVGQAVLKRAWASVGLGLLRVLSNFLRVAWCVK